MKKIIITLILTQLFTTLTYAQDSGFGGDTGWSGGGSDSSPVGGGFNFGGGGSGNDSDAGSASLNLLGSDNTSTDTTTYRAPETNPVTDAFGNFFDIVSKVSPFSGSAENFYGFTDPLITGKRWTGFLDLNFDGERGGLADVLLYNLYASSFSDGSESMDSQTSPDKRAKKAQESMKSNLTQQEISLVKALDSGETTAELGRVIQVFNAYNEKEHSMHDRQVAFESLLDLALKSPAVTAHDGPLVGRLWNASRENYQGLFRNLSLKKLSIESGLENSKSLASKNYQLSLSRFLALLVMHDQAERNQTPISDRANDALRASFYGVSLNIKRLSITVQQRQRLINSFMNQMSQSNSPAVLKMARVIVNEKNLESLSKGIYDLAALRTEKSVLNHWGFKSLVHLSAAGTALAAWLAYGQHAINALTLSIGQQWMASRGFGIVIVLATVFVSRAAYQKWMNARSATEARRSEKDGFGFKDAVSGQVKMNINSAADVSPTKTELSPMMCLQLFKN